MIRRAPFIAAGAFFLIAGVIGGFFSYTGLDAANRWSSVISMFLALASFVLSALLFRQSTVKGSPTAPAPEANSLSKYQITNHYPKHVFIGDNPTHNTTMITERTDHSPDEGSNVPESDRARHGGADLYGDGRCPISRFRPSGAVRGRRA